MSIDTSPKNILRVVIHRPP